jgi:hypothetical protein
MHPLRGQRGPVLVGEIRRARLGCCAQPREEDGVVLLGPTSRRQNDARRNKVV